jgi:hypothetical protein
MQHSKCNLCFSGPRIVVLIFLCVIFQAAFANWDGQSACMHFPCMCPSIKRSFGGFFPAQSWRIRRCQRIPSVPITDAITACWFRQIRPPLPYQEDKWCILRWRHNMLRQRKRGTHVKISNHTLWGQSTSLRLRGWVAAWGPYVATTFVCDSCWSLLPPAADPWFKVCRKSRWREVPWVLKRGKVAGLQN